MGEATNTWAVVDGSGAVVNIVLWDGIAQWSPPEGTTAVNISSDDLARGAGIGWTYKAGVFSAPA